MGAPQHAGGQDWCKIMAESQETELKLLASPAMLLHLRGHALLAGSERPLTLVTRYFDSDDAVLHRAGASLRLREGDAHAEQTFKTGAKGNGSVRRGEWNAPATGATPDPAAFADTPRELLGELLDGKALQPLTVSRIERTTRRLRFAGSTIEAAFDFGTLEGGGRSEPVCELELELVRGSAADLFTLAQQLPVGPELAWSVDSKAARGERLALALPLKAVRAGDVALSRQMDVGQGFQAIAWDCLAQLLGNYRTVIETGDANAVHQSRVAIRRLRASFSLFGKAIADDESPIFRAEWKAAASGLGPARDLHVLVERVEAAAAETGSDAGRLLDRLRAERAAAVAAAQAMLAGETFQQLLLRFAEWLEREPWRARADGKRHRLIHFAEHTLSRRRRKLAKARPLDALDDEALHELRIRGKKLRYAAEFFATLFPGVADARHAFGKSLAKLQDCLGSVHDLAVAHEQRERLFAGLEPIAAAGLSAQLAELLDRHGPTRKQLIRAAGKALDRVAQAPAWWKFAAEPETQLQTATAD
jgi:inorganic triphosphatase YgiF